MDPYTNSHLINVDGRMVRLESFNVDPSWRGEWVVLGLAIGFLAGMLVAMWFNWPCPSDLLRPYLECPQTPIGG